ncbi:hypothetical protein NliqN6_4139 [Naganishia liquefaciens]|uniref:Uncharacterized protein n=1 Tax=Naganishia liquefaciens TaxID=104408 RepID=A0A8H3TV60_9TREE|nr:hypothetical protein NliqN6_4139 [Naganishia liquefaciens]
MLPVRKYRHIGGGVAAADYCRAFSRLSLVRLQLQNRKGLLEQRYEERKKNGKTGEAAYRWSAGLEELFEQIDQVGREELKLQLVSLILNTSTATGRVTEDMRLKQRSDLETWYERALAFGSSPGPKVAQEVREAALRELNAMLAKESKFGFRILRKFRPLKSPSSINFTSSHDPSHIDSAWDDEVDLNGGITAVPSSYSGVGAEASGHTSGASAFSKLRSIRSLPSLSKKSSWTEPYAPGLRFRPSFYTEIYDAPPPARPAA